MNLSHYILLWLILYGNFVVHEESQFWKLVYSLNPKEPNMTDMRAKGLLSRKYVRHTRLQDIMRVLSSVILYVEVIRMIDDIVLFNEQEPL